MKKFITALVIAGICAAGFYRWQNAQQATQNQPSEHARIIPVVTAIVENKALSADIKLVGKLAAEHSVYIAPQVTGKIAAISVRSNQQVSAGQQLLKLEDAKAVAAVMEAKAYLADEQRKLQEYEKLAHSDAITQTEIDAQRASVDIATARLASAEADLAYHHIKAPFNGVVGLVDFSLGKMVTQGTELLSLDDLSVLRLDLQVPEAHLSQLSLGMLVSARSAAWPGETFSGKVVAIDPRINEETLNVRTRVQFSNPQHKLRPGMMLEATMSFAPEHHPVIPVQALEYSGTKRFVYKVDDTLKAQRTQVQLGARIDNLVLITDGLQPGDQIVVQGLVNIRDGMQVKPQPTGHESPSASQTPTPRESHNAAL
ncbi:efflux RND transporter periplasmic adaptor subunit [Shewanella sp. YIC-542]|uniref:efflux RND transporter periplasmic adaptor subunit n=1 Tax=Shewanella mytili TaxID=3377111 RepID=UPI00398ECF31